MKPKYRDFSKLALILFILIIATLIFQARNVSADDSSQGVLKWGLGPRQFIRKGSGIEAYYGLKNTCKAKLKSTTSTNITSTIDSTSTDDHWAEGGCVGAGVGASSEDDDFSNVLMVGRPLYTALMATTSDYKDATGTVTRAFDPGDIYLGGKISGEAIKKNYQQGWIPSGDSHFRVLQGVGFRASSDYSAYSGSAAFGGGRVCVPLPLFGGAIPICWNQSGSSFSFISNLCIETAELMPNGTLTDFQHKEIGSPGKGCERYLEAPTSTPNIVVGVGAGIRDTNVGRIILAYRPLTKQKIYPPPPPMLIAPPYKKWTNNPEFIVKAEDDPQNQTLGINDVKFQAAIKVNFPNDINLSDWKIQGTSTLQDFIYPKDESNHKLNQENDYLPAGNINFGKLCWKKNDKFCLPDGKYRWKSYLKTNYALISDYSTTSEAWIDTTVPDASILVVNSTNSILVKPAAFDPLQSEKIGGKIAAGSRSGVSGLDTTSTRILVYKTNTPANIKSLPDPATISLSEWKAVSSPAGSYASTSQGFDYPTDKNFAYVFRFIAYDNAGNNSGWKFSKWNVGAGVISPKTPAPVLSIDAKCSPQPQISLNWTKPNLPKPATGYSIYKSSSPDPYDPANKIADNQANKTSYVDGISEIDKEKTFYYCVAAKTADGESECSNIESKSACLVNPYLRGREINPQ